jgi:hypothetical protein
MSTRDKDLCKYVTQNSLKERNIIGQEHWQADVGDALEDQVLLRLMRKALLERPCCGKD